MGFHNVHWDDRAAAEQPVSVAPWSTSRKFDNPGTYRFYCDQHGGPGGSGVSGVVFVSAGATTTQTTGTTSTRETTAPNPPPPPAETTPQTTTTGSTATTPTVAPDTRAPALTARAGKLRRRLAFTFSVTERARIVAVIRGNGLKTTVRFVLVPGNRTRVLLRKAKPGRYTITLTATDEAGNRARTVRKTVRVQR